MSKNRSTTTRPKGIIKRNQSHDGIIINFQSLSTKKPPVILNYNTTKIRKVKFFQKFFGEKIARLTYQLMDYWWRATRFHSSKPIWACTLSSPFGSFGQVIDIVLMRLELSTKKIESLNHIIFFVPQIFIMFTRCIL